MYEKESKVGGKKAPVQFRRNSTVRKRRFSKLTRRRGNVGLDIWHTGMFETIENKTMLMKSFKEEAKSNRHTKETGVGAL
jgi:hypothetical protein